MNKGMTVAAMVAALMGVACAEGPASRQDQAVEAAGGAVAGAAIGRVVNYTTQATVIGAVVGTAVGFSLGSYGDFEAQEHHAAATVTAAESGQTVAWTTSSGSSGSVSAEGNLFTGPGDLSCRSLHQQATVKGDRLDRVVTACKSPDETWVVMPPSPTE